jgi:hypothetical protein
MSLALVGVDRDDDGCLGQSTIRVYLPDAGSCEPYLVQKTRRLLTIEVRETGILAEARQVLPKAQEPRRPRVLEDGSRVRWYGIQCAQCTRITRYSFRELEIAGRSS